MSRDRELARARRLDESAEPGRRESSRILALQRAAGNQAVGHILARKPSSESKGGTIALGKLAIEVAGGNIAAWASSDVPDALEVTSKTGPHSAELERMSKEHTRVTSLTLTIAAANKPGQSLDMGSLAIEITNARIKGYQVDGDAESWQVRDFDGVHRTKTTHTVG